jgi:DNA primase
MSLVEKIKSQVHLPEYVGEVVSLKKKGSSLWGLCPFHADKNESFQVWFSVRECEWVWTCQSGCGSGDIINFYAKLHALPLRAAIAALGEEFGIFDNQPTLTPFEQKARQLSYYVTPVVFRNALAITYPEKSKAIVDAFNSGIEDPILLYLSVMELHPTKTNKQKALEQWEHYASQLKGEAQCKR